MLARCSACTNDAQSESEQPPAASAGAAPEQRSKVGGRSAALCRQPGWGALWRWLRGGTPSWIAGAGAGICVTPAWPRRVPPPSPHSSCGYSIISAQQQHPRPDQACCCAAAEQPVSTAPACAPPPHRRGGGRQECGSVNDARPRRPRALSTDAGRACAGVATATHRPNRHRSLKKYIQSQSQSQSQFIKDIQYNYIYDNNTH